MVLGHTKAGGEPQVWSVPVRRALRGAWDFLTYPEQCRQTSFAEAYLTLPQNTAVQGLHV